jgi:hypothetical protein
VRRNRARRERSERVPTRENTHKAHQDEREAREANRSRSPRPRRGYANTAPMLQRKAVESPCCSNEQTKTSCEGAEPTNNARKKKATANTQRNATSSNDVKTTHKKNEESKMLRRATQRRAELLHTREKRLTKGEPHAPSVSVLFSRNTAKNDCDKGRKMIGTKHRGNHASMLSLSHFLLGAHSLWAANSHREQSQTNANANEKQT